MPKLAGASAPLRHLRTPVSRGLKARKDDRIVREGGDYGAGVIYGASVITRGEALGHGMWIDGTMLQQVADAINAAGDTGMKARFTHPSLSADGLGTYMGRFKNATVEGDQVFSDLHFAAAAHNSPDGDLASYTMDLAQDDPDQFGTSIVFSADRLAEKKFEADNSTADAEGNPRFKSPDADNVNNYRHARLKKLHGVDAVDEPAANPNGLFSRHQELAAEAEALLSYALLDGERPELCQLSLDPDRAVSFVHRFLGRHGLTIEKEGTMPAPTTSPEATLSAGDAALQGDGGSTPTASASQSADAASQAGGTATTPTAAGASSTPAERQFTAKELASWKEEFGADNAFAWLSEGISLEEARKRFSAKLREQLAAADAKAKELEQRLAQAHTGEATPLGAAKDDSGGKAAPDATQTKDNYAAAAAAIEARMPKKA